MKKIYITNGREFILTSDPDKISGTFLDGTPFAKGKRISKEEGDSELERMEEEDVKALDAMVETQLKEQQVAQEAAIKKLVALGLTEDEAKALT